MPRPGLPATLTALPSSSARLKGGRAWTVTLQRTEAAGRWGRALHPGVSLHWRSSDPQEQCPSHAQAGHSPPEGPLPLWNEDPEDIGGPRPFKPPPQAALSVTISQGPPRRGCFSEPEEGTSPRPSALAQPPGLGLASLSPIPAPSGVTEPPWHPAPRRAAPHTLV